MFSTKLQPSKLFICCDTIVNLYTTHSSSLIHFFTQSPHREKRRELTNKTVSFISYYILWMLNLRTATLHICYIYRVYSIYIYIYIYSIYSIYVYVINYPIYRILSLFFYMKETSSKWGFLFAFTTGINYGCIMNGGVGGNWLYFIWNQREELFCLSCFLFGIHSMQGWIAFMRHEVTEKELQKG